MQNSINLNEIALANIMKPETNITHNTKELEVIKDESQLELKLQLNSDNNDVLNQNHVVSFV